MSQSIPLSSLEGGAGAKFTDFGDKYQGRIVNIDERQQTDMDNQPLSFKDGSPRMQYVITLEQESGDNIMLFAKGGNYQPETGEGQSMLNAIGTAVRAAGASSLDVGGWLGVAYTGEATPGTGKKAKLYTASYKPPAAQSIPAASLFGDG